MQIKYGQCRLEPLSNKIILIASWETDIPFFILNQTKDWVKMMQILKCKRTHWHMGLQNLPF